MSLTSKLKCFLNAFVTRTFALRYLNFNDLVELGFGYWFQLSGLCWAWVYIELFLGLVWFSYGFGLKWYLMIVFGISMIGLWVYVRMGSVLSFYFFCYLGFGLGVIWDIEMGFIFILFGFGLGLSMDLFGWAQYRRRSF